MIRRYLNLINLTHITITLLLYSYSSLSYGLASDRDQPIHIEADYVELNEKSGTSIYKGNVKFVQGSLLLTGDKVIVYQPERTLKRVLVYGKPAHFQQQQDNSPDLVQADAEKIEYITARERVLLDVNATVKQGDNLLSGDHIEYDTRRSTVFADKGKTNTRVNAILEPDKQKN